MFKHEVIKTYVVWNPSKLSIYTGLDETLYSSLVAHEDDSGTSLSTTIQTTDISSILELVNQECDIQSCIHQIPTDYSVCIYDKGNYSNYSDALKSGAIYTLPSTHTIEELSIIYEAVRTAQICTGYSHTQLGCVFKQVFIPIEEIIDIKLK